MCRPPPNSPTPYTPAASEAGTPAWCIAFSRTSSTASVSPPPLAVHPSHTIAPPCAAPRFVVSKRPDRCPQIVIRVDLNLPSLHAGAMTKPRVHEPRYRRSGLAHAGCLLASGSRVVASGFRIRIVDQNGDAIPKGIVCAFKRSCASLLHTHRAGAKMRPYFRDYLRIGHFVVCLNRFDMYVSLLFFESLIQFVLSLTRAKE